MNKTNAVLSGRVPYLNDIVSKAVLLDTNVSDHGGQSLFVHSFYAIADIGNGKELLKLYVEELNSPNSDNDIQRTYMLQNIEKKQLGLTSSQNKSASSIAQTASIKNVADLFAVVKAKQSVSSCVYQPILLFLYIIACVFPSQIELPLSVVMFFLFMFSCIMLFLFINTCIQ